MKKILVPFADTHQFSSLIDEYLSGNASLKSFYRLAPEAGSFKQAIESRLGHPVNRKVLTESLNEQYGSLLKQTSSASEKTNAAIGLLENENCFTVTTGHQLNIFTGPLFFIYKIATTIRLSRDLKALHPDCDFVPVYWMATEDHDFNEINNTRIFGKPVVWNREAGGAVGRMNLNGMKEVLDEVKEIVGSDAGDCLSIFENAYLTAPNLAVATRQIVHQLFGAHGLVVIDGDDAALKKEFVNEMRDDLLLHKSFDAVTATSQKLSEIHKIQVQPRQINLFYIASGLRERIVKNEDGTYAVLNSDIAFSREKILQELESNPENFSPNVVLRPMYQEKILPNLAYISGPGELNYWLQFMGAFDANKISFPVLILRNCFQLVDSGAASKLSKLGIDIPDFFQSTDFLILKVLENSTDVHVGTDAITSLLQKIFNELGEEWSKLDASLLSSIDAEKQKMLKSIAGLEEKARRALKRKNETVVNQVKNLKDKLLPEGGLQERYENFIPYYCRLKDDFIREIISHSNPFEKNFIVLMEE